MSLFDAFTGDSAKDAAAQNSALYQKNQQQGIDYLNTGYGTGQTNLKSAVGAYTPLASLGQQYSGAPTMLLNALGANGQGGMDAARSAFQSSPGYQFQLGQGLQAIDRGAAAKGMLSSGNTLTGEQQYGQGLANQDYQQWLSNLGGFTNPALAGVGSAASGTAQGYTNLGNLGMTNAENLTNLGTTTTSGVANSNTAAANAETQASGNLWNGLFSLAGSAAKGYFGGGK